MQNLYMRNQWYKDAISSLVLSSVLAVDLLCSAAGGE